MNTNDPEITIQLAVNSKGTFRRCEKGRLRNKGDMIIRVPLILYIIRHGLIHQIWQYQGNLGKNNQNDDTDDNRYQKRKNSLKYGFKLYFTDDTL